ncbi:MAG: rhombotarget lipoprotein [Moraxellaceae bacterium]|nr:MAG: rhombotarget lipoprotein [Moraxellaceae bacterium]
MSLHLAKFFVLGFTLMLFGCANQQSGRKSSVVDYLYPKSAPAAIAPSIPTLQLPIKLGIAFVPDQGHSGGGGNFWSEQTAGSGLTELKKTHILASVAKHFKKYPFIGEIQEIPTTYLTPGGSFANLDQIKTMYGIDVIALTSFDQVQFTDSGFLSLTYWTLVGAYIVAGEKNDTNTLMDTVVYDIASRKLLFRAPGTSLIKGRATPVNLSEELRADSAKGFEVATAKMIENLEIQLQVFREKAKQNPAEVKIIPLSNSGSGGSLDYYVLSLLLLLAGGAFKRVAAGRGKKSPPSGATH